MSQERYTPKKQPDLQTFAFETAEEAWLWFILAQEARNEGARFTAGLSLMPRPCEPADILKCVEKLYRNRRLMMDHLLVLRHYGKRQLPPDARRIKEARAYTLWHEALERLEPLLESKGIVRTRFLSVQPSTYWNQKTVVVEGGLNA